MKTDLKKTYNRISDLLDDHNLESVRAYNVPEIQFINKNSKIHAFSIPGTELSKNPTKEEIIGLLKKYIEQYEENL